MENTPEIDSNPEQSAISLLNKRAETIQSSVKEISPQKKQELKETIGNFSQKFPEGILVGSNALRVWLDKKGFFVPEEFGNDVDFIMDKASFDKAKSFFNSENQSELGYRKKGLKENEQEFNKDPENYMALEDNKNFRHIDVFVGKEPFEKTDYQGIKLNIIQPEELFIKYANKAKDELEKGQIQRRTLTYYYLSSLIVDKQKLDSKIQQANSGRGTNIDWESEVKNLDAKIQQTKITEEVIH